MKKAFCVAAGFAVAATGVFAQERDSMRMIDMESVQVTSTRAGEKTPIAYTNVLKEEIKAQNWGQDLPFLLQMVPSVVVTSDAGSGIGYTSIRIRGTDPTRINVTSNGIPMNDAESHGLFWVNTPDIAGSAADIQVQRGVGTSTNGAGAFGGSINLRTETTPAEPYAEVSGSYGSYDTHKASIKLGTGLIGGRWSFGGRLTTIHSDGYVNRASTDLKSYFVQGGYAYGGTSVRVLVFGGRERTYHAWDGIAKDSLETNRRYNPSGEILNDAGDIVGYYKDQTDNYRLNNYQAFLTQRLGDNLFLNLAFHYYKGDGYYEQYKNGEVLARYALKPFDKVVDGQTVTVEESNLVRRKIMDNYFTGGIFSLDYDKGPLRVSLGGAANISDGKPYGLSLIHLCRCRRRGQCTCWLLT